LGQSVLIIEDIAEMSELIKMYLENAKLEVHCCETAEAAIDTLADFTPNLILLDLNLPGMSGFDFLHKLKEGEKKDIPVIIVSARDADEDIIQGLGFGADDFISKPFSPRILVARVQANLRLHSQSNSSERKISFGPFTLLLESCVLKKDDKKIPLSSKEYDVLEFLIENEGQALSPEKIYNSVWKNQYGDVTAVAVYIQRLRKKIELDPLNPVYIKTIFGMGYKFFKE